MNVVTFITIPQTTKTEIRNFLQTVYKVEVSKVHTINYEGKKKRAGSKAFFRRPDYKKVYVQLKEKWFPPNVFSVIPRDGDASKGHKEKLSPIKNARHNKNHWLVNGMEPRGPRPEYQKVPFGSQSPPQQ
mmetsp:Transcript_16467/g.40334  ORF Transcript_16467/g.40334 Transcript_16467/m.40334 type:complete len:130 (-) Transcript_16467:286-675(-)